MKHIAILGGTFDPIHLGHLKISTAIQSHCHFDSFYFLPCKIPVLKAASSASSAQRIDMLKLALEPLNAFQLDLREITRATPSYMVETLKSYRQEYPLDSITLIMGYDAFLSLPLWHEWENLLKLANLLVVERKEHSIITSVSTLKELLAKHQITSLTKFLESRCSSIFLFDAGDYAISSSHIRDLIKKGQNIKNLVPEAICEYIQLNKIYI